MDRRQTDKAPLYEALRGVFVQRGYDGATLVHLSEAAGLSKASLYHHFPGGKPEMAAQLVRYAITDLQNKAFTHLAGSGSPQERIGAFIQGFQDYVEQGRVSCLLAVLAHHDAAGETMLVHQEAIAAQFRKWHSDLTEVFCQCNMKPKRARRSAHDLLASLYGALLNARLQASPELFTLTTKRLAKNYL